MVVRHSRARNSCYESFSVFVLLSGVFSSFFPLRHVANARSHYVAGTYSGGPVDSQTSFSVQRRRELWFVYETITTVTIAERLNILCSTQN